MNLLVFHTLRINIKKTFVNVEFFDFINTVFIRFCVNILPRINCKSSLRVEIFDLLIFPINLNLDNRGYSFKIIFNETLSFETLSKVISISEKRFCCHNLLMAELILLPGTLII